MPASRAVASVAYSAITHGTDIDIVRSRNGVSDCWAAASRSSERSEPSCVLSGAQIEITASTSRQIRSCSGAVFRSTSSGASRANGPPIDSKASWRSG